MIVTKSGLADELGVSRPRISQFVALGMPVRLDGALICNQYVSGSSTILIRRAAARAGTLASGCFCWVGTKTAFNPGSLARLRPSCGGAHNGPLDSSCKRKGIAMIIDIYTHLAPRSFLAKMKDMSPAITRNADQSVGVVREATHQLDAVPQPFGRNVEVSAAHHGNGMVHLRPF
jgi:hypothetical protein